MYRVTLESLTEHLSKDMHEASLKIPEQCRSEKLKQETFLLFPNDLCCYDTTRS